MSKETKQVLTPGPWSVINIDSKDGSYGPNIAVVPSWELKRGKYNTPICLVSPLSLANETDSANAKLIAAAPELLDACKALRAAIGDCGYECRQGDVDAARKLADEIIAKAEGREPSKEDFNAECPE